MPFSNRPRTKPINTPKRNSLVSVSIFVDVIGGSWQICFIALNNIYCVVVDFWSKLTSAVFIIKYPFVHHILRMIIRQTRISAHWLSLVIFCMQGNNNYIVKRSRTFPIIIIRHWFHIAQHINNFHAIHRNDTRKNLPLYHGYTWILSATSGEGR